VAVVGSVAALPSVGSIGWKHGGNAVGMVLSLEIPMIAVPSVGMGWADAHAGLALWLWREAWHRWVQSAESTGAMR